MTWFLVGHTDSEPWPVEFETTFDDIRRRLVIMLANIGVEDDAARALIVLGAKRAAREGRTYTHGEPPDKVSGAVSWGVVLGRLPYSIGDLVCEDHPYRSWNNGDGCCGAAGMPNPHIHHLTTDWPKERS